MLGLGLHFRRRASGVTARVLDKWLAIGFAAALICAPAVARAEDDAGYGDRVKAVVARVMANREFKPGAGCDKIELCSVLIRQLRAGDFSVIEPIERSERPDMPSYRRIRQKCAKVDPLHLRASHHINVATRNFAMYRLDVPKQTIGGDEILVFRGEHYLPVDRPAGASRDERAVWPGMFVAVGYPSCRQFSNATAQEGDRLARHNSVNENDFLSELVKIGSRYFIINLDPIAAPNQPRAVWWYDLELWDWGPRADADLRHGRHVYSFSYRPVSVNVTDSEKTQSSAR
jgi:hypothetical protein